MISWQAGALVAVGGILLYFGAEWLVRGASGLAAKLRVRPLVIGLTVVAYGTSAPELVVGVSSALAGRGGIAFGNAVGSNVANLGLILGTTALVSPPRMDGSLLRRELPAMVMSALIVPVLLLDGQVSRLEGACLLVAAASYTYIMIRASRGESLDAPVADAREAAHEASVASAAPTDASAMRLGLSAVLGLGGLLLGGSWFVDGASAVARSLGMSERLVGLTIVAVGTSLPELATSLVAARRGHSDLAVGNVVGSNIFNILLILGASGLAGPLRVGLRESRIELGVLGLMTLLAGVFMRTARRMTRAEGGVLVALYASFLLLTVAASFAQHD